MTILLASVTWAYPGGVYRVRYMGVFRGRLSGALYGRTQGVSIRCPGIPLYFGCTFSVKLEIIVETARGAWRPPALVHQMRIFLIYKLRRLPLVLPFGPQSMGGYRLLKGGGGCPDKKKCRASSSSRS